MIKLNETLTYGAQTDRGCKRAHNEDSFGVLADTGLWVIADGMGGHGGGEVASRIAVDRVIADVKAGEGLVEAIESAHQAVVEAAGRGEGAPQMGTTLVALHSDGEHYQVAWVGDSRAYLWDGTLRQLTRDHSLVQEYLDDRDPDAAAVDLGPWSNVITRCVGPANDGVPRVDLVSGDWHAREKLLLCSDGLYRELDAQRMSDLIAGAASGDDQALAERLVQAACDAGGADNVTAVLVSARATGRHSSDSGGRHSQRIIVIGALAAVLLALALYYFTAR